MTDRPYTFTEAELDALTVILASSNEHAALEIFEETHDLDLRELFVQFVRLAKSVQENTREAVDFVAITEFDMNPMSHETPNLPTLSGALHGYRLAAKVRPERLCDGCAYRLGSIANQSAITTDDADYCANERHHFLCHERVDARGQPYQACAGYAQQKRQLLSGGASDGDE